MLDKMLRTIEKHRLIAPGNHVIVGLSGGADSVTLLLLLLACKEAYNLNISAVHVHHGIRGKQADRDEAFVQVLCEARQIPLFVYRRDVPSLAKIWKVTVEEAGRIVRYDSFEQARVKAGADKIAIAHHKNDNAETLLMRFCRGTGLKGLAGIPYIRGRIIRPLLDISKMEIEAYCAQNHVRFQQDDTNLDSAYTRNSIRLKLIPYIERELNPAIIGTLHRAASLYHEDSAFLDELAREAYERSRQDTADMSLCVPTLLSYHKVIQSRVIRLCLSKLSSGLHDISYDHIQRILDLLTKQTGATICLPRGAVAERRYDALFLYQKPPAFKSFCYNLPLGQPVFIQEAYKTICLVPDNMPVNIHGDYTKVFHKDKIKYNSLQVRSRKVGDRIYIAQIHGHKKIKDYFIDQKIPRQERERIPLLAIGSDVLWIMDEKSIVSSHYRADAGDNETLTAHVWDGPVFWET